MTHSKEFHFHSGKKIDSLKDLARELKGMSHDVYNNHVNEMKNDFATWINHSLGQVSLSNRIEGQINKIEMELEVLRHLVFEAQTEKKVSNKKKNSPPKKKKSMSTKKGQMSLAMILA